MSGIKNTFTVLFKGKNTDKKIFFDSYSHSSCSNCVKIGTVGKGKKIKK